jgi:hypothetical protein
MQQNMEVDPACQSSNTTMQQLCVRSTRRGLLEVLKAPTSELIPPLVQSLRALQCRLRAVCMAGRASQNPKAGATVSVQPEGCLALEFPTFQGCKLKDQTFADVKGGNCEKTVDVILDQEINLLHLAVGYDAAYRSLYQFGGMFEDAMREFRFPILTPIWQAVRALSNIAGLPCFLSQCEE